MSLYSSLITSITGLQAYYHLNESSGAVAFDSSGNGLDGTLSGVSAYGVASLVSNDSDTALSFTASGGLTVPASLSQAIRAWTALSAVLWFDLGTGKHCVGVSMTTIDSTALYLDGIPVASGSDGSILVSQVLDMIGSLTLPGTLDEVSLFNVALSPAQFLVISHTGYGLVDLATSVPFIPTTLSFVIGGGAAMVPIASPLPGRPYILGGNTLDTPAVCTAPLTMAGNVVSPNALFLLTWSTPSSITTVTLSAAGTPGARTPMQFSLANGLVVTGIVSASVTIQGSQTQAVFTVLSQNPPVFTRVNTPFF